MHRASIKVTTYSKYSSNKIIGWIWIYLSVVTWWDSCTNDEQRLFSIKAYAEIYNKQGASWVTPKGFHWCIFSFCSKNLNYNCNCLLTMQSLSTGISQPTREKEWWTGKHWLSSLVISRKEKILYWVGEKATSGETGRDCFDVR